MQRKNDICFSFFENFNKNCIPNSFQNIIDKIDELSIFSFINSINVVILVNLLKFEKIPSKRRIV